LGDIATAAGVSRMTVSYALRNHPKISAATRQRVQRIARELCYAPDAEMHLAMRQIQKAKVKELLPIAWINNDPEPDLWQRYAYLTPFRKGAEARGRELGYKLEDIWARAPGMTLRRISSILFHRGIQGVILAPSLLNSIEHFRLDWKHFACVSFEKSVMAPRVHRITPDYLYNMTLALRMARRLGYRRIGVLLSTHFVRRSHHSYGAAVSDFHNRVPEAERIPPLFFSLGAAGRSDPRKAIAASQWLETHRPDVLICQHSAVPDWLQSLGYRVPEDIGVLHLAIDGDVEDWAGIWQKKNEIGGETVELLVSLMQRHRHGLPETPHDTVIPGCWKFGWTLRDLRLAKAPATKTARKKSPRAR
jgi:LacI family transcriptional regulator